MTTTTEVECLRVQYMSGGHRVTGYIVKPTETNGKKYPVFVVVPPYHPGGRIQFLNLFNFYGRVRGQGVVVVFPAFRGNDGGEGRDEFGGGDVEDLVNLAALARAQPYMDADNLFLYGGGRGGMMIYLALIRGMPARAAAVENAPSDVRRWAAQDTAVLRVLQQANSGFERTAEEHYRARSILEHLERIDTPLLIRHGSGNRRVPVSHTLELVERLEALGKTYKLVIYPNDDPDIQKNDPEDDRLAHEWLRTHLPGIPPWPSQRVVQAQGTPVQPERTPVPVASGRGEDEALALDSVQAHRAAMHFLAAFDSLQWEPFRAYFAPDVNTFPNRSDEAGRREGRDAIAGWEQFFREVRANRASRGQPGPPYLDIGRRMRDLRVQLAGAAAVVSFLLGDDAPSRRTLVFRRDPDGAWRLIHLHASPAPQAGQR
ncbi:MAG: prolyl oligopeptidase family serine peptidase [Gemmatimonadetes bacterium]|nr:prolyl oligopeptidase family serine peptidase [Gemmatimonadota bacterium]